MEWKGGEPFSVGVQYVSYRWVVCTLPWYCCPLPRSTLWPTPTSLPVTPPLSVAYVPSALSVPTHVRKELHQSRDHFHIPSQKRLITIYLTQVYWITLENLLTESLQYWKVDIGRKWILAEWGQLENLLTDRHCASSEDKGNRTSFSACCLQTVILKTSSLASSS